MPGLKQYFHENTAFRYFVLYSLPAWSDISTLNYGYAPVSREVLDAPISRKQAFQIELYRQAFLALGRLLSPEQCLCEVSCGRGGGLAFIAGRTRARCIGLEKSWPARRYAKKRLGLDVRASTASSIALETASVDAFLSVEAFHNYANDRFLQEAARCLKPGGTLVIADRRSGSSELNKALLIPLLERSGFRIAMYRDITANVLEALRADHDRKEGLLRPVSGTFVYDELREMFACMGTIRYRDFRSGDWSYFLFSASFKFQVSSFKFQVSSFKFQVSSFKFQVSSFKFQVSSFKFQVSSFKFQVSSFKFQVSSLDVVNKRSSLDFPCTLYLESCNL